MGIPVGSSLVYEGDGVTTCTVVDGRRVNYDGRILSITRLTAELRNQPDRQTISGSANWSFQGRLLNDIYEETITRKALPFFIVTRKILSNVA